MSETNCRLVGEILDKLADSGVSLNLKYDAKKKVWGVSMGRDKDVVECVHRNLDVVLFEARKELELQIAATDGQNQLAKEHKKDQKQP